MSEWKEYNLEEIASITDCEHKTAPLVQSSEFISVRTSNISNGKIDFDNCNRVSKETYDIWTQRMIPREGDIILAREAPVGEVGLIPSGKKVCLGQRTVLIRVNDPSINSKFLLYYLVNRETKFELVSRSTGSVVEHLNVKDIREFAIKIPGSLPEQTAIAEVLSSLDDKIDLLHRQNKTLEQLAETLFRQWFVEEAEEGWEIKKVSEIIEVRDGTHDSPKQKESGKYLITSKHLKPTGIDFESAYKISEEDFIEVNKRSKVETGDILFSMIGTLGLIHFVTDEPIYAIKNIGLFKSSQKPEFAKYLYLLIKSPLGETFIYENATGSTQEYITLGSLRNFEFKYPGDDRIRQFEMDVAPMFDKIISNTQQIRTLTQLRDTLLPKLMSGEVRVAN